MPVELLDQAADDVEEVIIAWLQPLRRASNTRRAGDELPFTLVNHITGTESVDLSWTDELVSIHTLCDKNLGTNAAKVEGQRTHRRMTLQARYLEDVVLSDGRIASIDWVKVSETPRFAPYADDQILQIISRYQVGLSYTEVQ
jgi:hypothetical protein